MCYKVHPKTFWKPHNLREHFRDAQRGCIILLLSSILPKNNPIIVGIYFMISRWSNCLSLSPVQTIGVGIHPRCRIFQVSISKIFQVFIFKNFFLCWIFQVFQKYPFLVDVPCAFLLKKHPFLVDLPFGPFHFQVMLAEFQILMKSQTQNTSSLLPTDLQR